MENKNYDENSIVLNQLENNSKVIKAFIDIMDATLLSDLRAMTGLSAERCVEIKEIYLECLKKI